MNENQVTHPILKVASVGMALWGGLTWGEIASMLAALYTTCLIADWWWKRFGKAFAIRRGWKKGAPRDYMDSTSRMPLDPLDPP